MTARPVLSKNSSFGFTLVELMIVMAVIAVLATLSLFGIRAAQSAARDSSRQQIMRGIQTALQRYAGDTGNYPSGGTPAMDWACLLDLLQSCNYFSSIPKDPLTPGAWPDLSCDGASGTCGAITCRGWGGVPKGNTTWCGGYNGAGGAWPAGYSYSSNGSAYTLTLAKESGGTSTFLSPQ